MPLPTIPSGNVTSGLATGFNVDNSCRFNDGDSPSLSKTMVAGSTDFAKKFTISVWFKLGAISGARPICSFGSGTSNAIDLLIDTNSKATFESWDGSVNPKLATNRLLRDYSAWYNIIIVVDTTQGVAANRIKMYINGTQETSFASSTYPSENYAFPNIASTGDTMKIGNGGQYSSNYYDGYISEFVYCDGQVLSPTDFGEFDEDSPTIWKPIDVSGLTFGNAGTYCDFKDSDNLGDDESGNANDLTENNIVAADQAVDTPTNNFCTLNPLNEQAWTYSEGNCQATNTSSSWRFTHGTMGASTGKWYFEAENDAYGAGSYIGVVGTQDISHGVDENFKTYATGYGYKGGDGTKANNASGSSYGDTYTDGDIIGCALDLTNGAIYWSKNGIWQNSATTAEIAAGTTTNAAYTSIPSGEGYIYLPAISGKTNLIWKMNLGGCSAFTVSSANQDANGYGNFEYPPPAGFLAYCSKNIGDA